MYRSTPTASIMKLVGFTNMCTPAYVYLVISTMALTVMFAQNFYVIENRFGSPDHNVYCLGSYTCNVDNVSMLFLIKILYILFWTWVLNLICGAGATGVAWFLVLLPFVLAFVLLSLLFMGAPGI